MNSLNCAESGFIGSSDLGQFAVLSRQESVGENCSFGHHGRKREFDDNGQQMERSAEVSFMGAATRIIFVVTKALP